MPKPWAVKFYNSKAWKQTRHAYMTHVGWECERCPLPTPAEILHHRRHLTPTNINDQDIALGWGNLEAVCRECHEHEHGEIRGQPSRKMIDKSLAIVGNEIVKNKRSEGREFDMIVNDLIV